MQTIWGQFESAAVRNTTSPSREGWLHTIRGMQRKSMRKPTSVVALSQATHLGYLGLKRKLNVSFREQIHSTPAKTMAHPAELAICIQHVHRISSTFIGERISLCGGVKEAFGGGRKGNTIYRCCEITQRPPYIRTSGRSSKRLRFVSARLSGRAHACGAAKFGQKHFTCGGVLAPLAQRQK